MSAILRLYMKTTGSRSDCTVKLSPKIVLGCATSYGNVFLDPGMILKTQHQFHFMKPHECLSVSTKIKHSEPWKLLVGGSYVEKIQPKVKELEDIFEDETEIPQVISLPEYLLSKSGGEKLSCTLHVDFNYKEGKMVMEEIQFEEDFTEAAKDTRPSRDSVPQTKCKESNCETSCVQDDDGVVEIILNTVKQDLLKKIQVDPQFLSHFSGVCSETERQEIKKEGIRIKQNDILLDMVARKGVKAYKVLRHSLEETRQSGALKALDEAEAVHGKPEEKRN